MKTQESKGLAASVQKHLIVEMRQRNQQVVNAGIKTAPFVVLLGVEVPSVLVEVSCLSNVEEEKRLSSSEYRAGLASYLENGIIEYLDQRGLQKAMTRTEGERQHVAKQEG